VGDSKGYDIVVFLFKRQNLPQKHIFIVRRKQKHEKPTEIPKH